MWATHMDVRVAREAGCRERRHGVSQFRPTSPCSVTTLISQIGYLEVSGKTIYWYDFETFGVDPRRDRASQFAGIRTDEDLNVIGEPLVLYCQPADDFLPSPMACVITGISPQKALAEGVNEAEFIKQIHREFSEPGTCVAGYNSIRFDDEVTRQLLYRNFYDAYEREWKHGNSRWDIIDMLRLCAATRPDGINWPRHEDGSNSFRLEQLTLANGIEHADAHDALADVIATIEMAKLIRQKQPKLFDYIYQLRNKKKVQAEIDMVTRKPLLHVSMMYPARRGCLALVMPICQHPVNKNGVIVYDLREDPSALLSLPVEQIMQRVFTSAEQLPDSVSRIPLKTIHINKCPVVTSPAVLDAARANDYEIDLQQCKRHWEMLQSSQDLAAKLAAVFNEEMNKEELDPDFMIYSGGFFGDNDKSLMQTIRSTSATDLGRLDLPFRDKRLREMLFRYRARNYKETLNVDELARWERFRQQKLSDSALLQRYQLDMDAATERAGEKDAGVLAQVRDYADSLTLAS